MRVIISGGGTGGHIFPAIAIANSIREYDKESEILFVGANGKMEMEKVPKAGYDIVGLNIAGFQRKKLWENITLPYKMWASSRKAKAIIKDFDPDIVIGVGGYASWATLKEAQKMNIPTLIDEQNSLAGLSNQRLAKKAITICTAYEGMEKYFPKQKIVLTGNPVRKNITIVEENAEKLKSEAISEFNLKEDVKTILVTGGSLGAGTINKSIEANLNYFIDNNIQILWQTGKYYYNGIVERTKHLLETNPKAKELIHINEFIFSMDKAYAVSDIVVARAGALTISELCCVKKPVILVPSPNVAEDHQTKNAMALVNRNAAIMVKDIEMQEKITSVIDGLLKDEGRMQEMSRNICAMAVNDASNRILEQILKIIGK